MVAILFAFQACQLNGPSRGKDNGWDSIPEVIETHDSTVIFVWSSWCQAGRLTFMETVVPYLNNPNENIGFVLVHFGKKDDVPEEVLERYKFINQSSHGGLDKMVANIRFKVLLKEYCYQNSMPMTILVDRQRRVLNYDSEKGEYQSLREILWQIRNR